MDLGRFAARSVIGGLFVAHGTQKLFGWFDGPGLEGTEQMMGALELRPTKVNALAAGVTETAGGALLVAGAATPLAASSLIGTMCTALWKVHKDKGPWATQGGYEYNLVLIAALAGLAESGPGRFSVDALLGRRRPGSAWALGALALGAAASAATMAAGKRSPAPEDATPDPDREVVEATRDDRAGDPVTSES